MTMNSDEFASISENFSSSCSTCSFTSAVSASLSIASRKRWCSLDLASTAMPSSALIAFSCSFRKYSRWLFEIFSLICSWILFWMLAAAPAPS